MSPQATSNPRVSVLIDTYNHERFIERAITSVLEQDMPMDGVEVIVVDDGSTDSTPEIVRRFEPRVRLIRKSNGGQASAFNTGIPECRGEIVAFLDGDDWWAAQKLRRVIETLDANQDVGIVGHGLHEEYSGRRPSGLILPGKVCRLDLGSCDTAELFRHLAAFFGTSRLTIRRTVLDRILPVPEELKIEADEYIFTLAPALSPAIVLNEPLCHYRLHGENLFQFGKFEPTKARRKMDVLNILLRDLPPKLRKMGVTDEIISVLFQGTRVESSRIRLSLDGGSPLEVFSVERAAFKTVYKGATWRYQFFRMFILMQTLLLPPRLFYRIRRWYSEQGLRRFRRWTGEPTRLVQIIERRPG